MFSAVNQRSRFDNKVAELRVAQGKMFLCSRMLIIKNMFKRLRRSKHPGTDYAGGENVTIIEKLVKPGTTSRYATFESLFDIIKEVHEEGLKHGCRDILNKKLQTMYANISVKQIQAFMRYVRLKRVE